MAPAAIRLENNMAGKRGIKRQWLTCGRIIRNFTIKSHARYKNNQYKKAAVETFLINMQNIFKEIKKPLPTCECISKLH